MKGCKPRGIGTQIAKTVGAVTVLVACPLALEAQPLPAQQTALTELRSLRIEVQLVGAASTIGFTESSISDAVEQRLRRGGLAVRSGDDQSARGDPRLRVAVQAVNAAGGGMPFSCPSSWSSASSTTDDTESWSSMAPYQPLRPTRSRHSTLRPGSNGRHRRWAQRVGRTRSTRFRMRSSPTWTGFSKTTRPPTDGKGCVWFTRVPPRARPSVR